MWISAHPPPISSSTPLHIHPGFSPTRCQILASVTVVAMLQASLVWCLILPVVYVCMCSVCEVLRCLSHINQYIHQYELLVDMSLQHHHGTFILLRE